MNDLSDLFGDVDLGSVTAPNGDTFTYDKTFTWADYGQAGCGDYQYDNTASLVGTDQSADATLLVNVQCFVYETAFAKGTTSPRCFLVDGFDRWGWTNPISKPGAYEWPLWAGAGQCDTSKGTLVGTVTVNVTAGGTVTYAYNISTGYDLQETHFYSGCNKYPKVLLGKKLVDTVAPGAYTNGGIASCASGWAIAHAVVGLPDPNFGP